MDRKLMNCIEDKLWQVLEGYANGFKGPSGGFKGPSDVETVKHALSGIFKIKCLEGMDDYYTNGSFRGGRSYDGDRSYLYYDDGMHGPYMSRGMSRTGGNYYGGSYGGSYDMDMKSKLEELMRNTNDEHQRHIIQDMMAKLR